MHVSTIPISGSQGSPRTSHKTLHEIRELNASNRLWEGHVLLRWGNQGMEREVGCLTPQLAEYGRDWNECLHLISAHAL